MVSIYKNEYERTYSAYKDAIVSLILRSFLLIMRDHIVFE